MLLLLILTVWWNKFLHLPRVKRFFSPMSHGLLLPSEGCTRDRSQVGFHINEKDEKKAFGQTTLR